MTQDKNECGWFSGKILRCITMNWILKHYLNLGSQIYIKARKEVERFSEVLRIEIWICSELVGGLPLVEPLLGI